MNTLVDLLRVRASTSTQSITFLDEHGRVESALSYAELYPIALDVSRSLLSSGIVAGTTNVIIASFSDARSSVIAFWACCLVGVPFCPLPAPHPDPSRQTALLEHLQSLFPSPVVLTNAAGAVYTASLVPSLKSLVLEDLPASADSHASPHQAQPSDAVAFMLTSGSTGKPKAVVLRHSNFIASCAGKAKHHGTSSETPFLNWIAFDHVASLSEIHIHALLVDAPQYHISPAAIVHQPRRFLELCSEHRIGYTFSPNFLLAHIIQEGQREAFDASADLSHLVAIISGGEAVPIKTAVAFADLLGQLGARRDVLRAGFGMSETAAGSIYDRAPITAEAAATDAQFLSLGTCCDGIVMRIVDETGASISGGGAGALQVRGPTVFTEYFGNPAATAEAFTADGWFITGDVGRLDGGGRLHLTGRDKDVLNVNGVKTSTAEIEAYVLEAAITGIAACSVFACPLRLEGAETETYAVFYQHEGVDVSEPITSEEAAAIRATASAIRTACIVVCSQAPYVILPLSAAEFTKTAIGKVSRAQLVKAYRAGKFESVVTQLAASTSTIADADSIQDSEVGRIVAECIVDTFGAEFVVDASTNVFDLGASSMHLMRIKHQLQGRLDLPDLPTIEMLRRPVVSDLIAYLEAARASAASGSRQVEYEPVVCLHAQGSKPPVFLIHPGVGEILVFINLARVLADDRPVYAIRARGFDHGDAPFETLGEMVHTYTDSIEKAYPSGPYFISGYSYGGAVAFEIGKLLEARGKTVSWLGVMNLPPHIQFRMKELIWAEVLINICMFLSLVPGDSLGFHREAMLDAFPALRGSDAEPTTSADIVRWMFARCDQARLVELDLEFGAFLRWVKVGYEINRTGREFEPRGAVRGALTSVFCAVPLPSMGTREEFKNNRLSAWREFSARFEMIDVDGEHYTMLSEVHVESFADKLRGALRRAEASPSATSERRVVSRSSASAISDIGTLADDKAGEPTKAASSNEKLEYTAPALLPTAPADKLAKRRLFLPWFRFTGTFRRLGRPKSVAV